MEWSFSRDTSSKFQSKTEIFHVMSPLNKISSSRNSRNPSIESWDEVTPHWSDGDNVRSEFPVKDTFSIGIQTIHKCTLEKGSQYHNMMIKNKHTQAISGYRLFMKSASQQTLPISCTCVNSKKKKKKRQNYWIRYVIYGFSFSSFPVSQCVHTWKYFKLLFQEI